MTIKIIQERIQDIRSNKLGFFSLYELEALEWILKYQKRQKLKTHMEWKKTKILPLP